MLLTLANVLDIPLRERNFLLLAAGYAPLYGETGLDDPRMSRVRAAVEMILKSNEPRSAYAHDRHWNIVMANAAFVRFITVVRGHAPAGLTPLSISASPRLNVLHLSYPDVPTRWREPDLEAPRDLILPMELNLGGKIARMFSTVTAVATPNDVTVQDLHIEAFYPADQATEELLLSPPWS
jgi:MmyB-like transcription regulator ligand binding domain